MDAAVHSMTGVGFAAGATEVGEVRIEVRSVNGRALSVRMRLSNACAGFEAAIEELVRQQVPRGSVTVTVELRSAGALLPDRALLRSVADELQSLAGELGLPPPSLVEVVQIANAGSRTDAATARPLPPRFRALVEHALAELQVHRRQDGAATAAAIGQQLDEFDAHVQSAAARAPMLAEAFRDRLLQKVRDFLANHGLAGGQNGGQLSAGDLVREVAIHADRVDVAEELQRLRAHLAEIRAVFARAGEVGRRLEFLLQELLRETNTLGSKSPDTVMSHTAVAMKTCIDRMKEQVANLQ